MKRLLIILMAVLMVVSVVGCTQAERVNHNISKDADRFNVCRRIEVINMRTDKPIFELTGFFSISNSSTNELVVTVEVGKGVYKKHYVYLNDWTMYVVEDLNGAKVSNYHYELNYLPEMIVPFEVTTKK